MIDTPSELVALCQFFHQDFALVYGSISEAVLAYKENAETFVEANLQKFLKVISETLTEAELHALWVSCGAQVHFQQGDYSSTFREIAGLLAD